MRTKSTSIMLEQLRELAKKASKGKWETRILAASSIEELADKVRDSVLGRESTDFYAVIPVDHPETQADPKKPVYCAMTGNGPTSRANAHYIAAASPERILALIDILDKLKAAEE